MKDAQKSCFLQKYFQEGMSPPEIESWMNYIWEIKQQTPTRLEDAAKYLSICITVATSFFIALVGKSNLIISQFFFIKGYLLFFVYH